MGARSKVTAISVALASALVLASCGGLASGDREDAGAADTGAVPNDAPSTDGRGESDSVMPCSPVTFHLRTAAASSSRYCIGRGCDVVWLELLTERGDKVTYSLPCELHCGDCRSTGCGPPICFTPRRMQAEGESLTWDGNVWLRSTCGNRSSCLAPTCAPPGIYVAKMCADANTVTDAGSCIESPSLPQTCVEIPFQYPTAPTVEAVLP